MSFIKFEVCGLILSWLARSRLVDDKMIKELLVYLEIQKCWNLSVLQYWPDTIIKPTRPLKLTPGPVLVWIWFLKLCLPWVGLGFAMGLLRVSSSLGSTLHTEVWSRSTHLFLPACKPAVNSKYTWRNWSFFSRDLGSASEIRVSFLCLLWACSGSVWSLLGVSSGLKTDLKRTQKVGLGFCYLLSWVWLVL